MVFGKQVRLSRLTELGKMVCVPLDHGFTNGPIKGIEDPEATVRELEKERVTAILAHKGIIKSLVRPPATGIILHLSASTTLGPSPNRKLLISSVEEGLRLGVDGISIHINVGSKEEPEMLQQLGQVADTCDEYQMPLLAMMYPRGELVKNAEDPEVVAHAARIGAEAGADVVKTIYTGQEATFRSVVRRCPVPVVIAGGPRAESDLDVLLMAEGAMRAGAMGVTFGRNVFQHESPRLMVRALRRVVIEGIPAAKAVEVLRVGSG
jgi:fructose-bisphosphate aldolase/2-amino-3,7-dideoxy-D-threo-hept-6-ulosonate synthase